VRRGIFDAERRMTERQLTQVEKESYRRDGYLLVHDLLAPGEVARFVTYEARQETERRSHLDNHKRDAEWRAIATHPNVGGIASQLLEAVPWIVQTMYLEKHPGEEAKGTALHQDTHYLPNEPNTLMACWLALSDTDEENGGLCVLPGSHRGPLYATHRASSMKDHQVWESEHLLRDRQGREWRETFYSFEIDGIDRSMMTFLTVPAGSGVFFTGMTIHGSYANRSASRVRRAFATHFVAEGTWVFRADVQEIVPVRLGADPLFPGRE
jgi:ectoine hydroxylase-related dioxygenase (phytanoyl-CoA dioxygenase family)